MERRFPGPVEPSTVRWHRVQNPRGTRKRSEWSGESLLLPPRGCGPASLDEDYCTRMRAQSQPDSPRSFMARTAIVSPVLIPSILT